MCIDILNSTPFTISPKAYLERSYYRKTKGHRLKVLSTEPLDVYIISEQELSNYKNKKPFKYIASFLNVKDSGKGLVFNVDEDFTLILENNSDKAAGGGFNMYDLQNQQPSYDQQNGSLGGIFVNKVKYLSFTRLSFCIAAFCVFTISIYDIFIDFFVTKDFNEGFILSGILVYIILSVVYLYLKPSKKIHK